MGKVQLHRNLKVLNNKLIILGSGGHGKVCFEVAERMNLWDYVAFLDDSYLKEVNSNELILGPLRDFCDYLNDADFFVAIGDNLTRKKYFLEIASQGGNLVNLIDPSAYISKTATIGIGNVIMANATINTNTVIKNCCIINSAAVIEHDSFIGNYVHVAPNATMAGSVKVGDMSLIGINSSILPNVSIGKKVIVGASTLVLNSVDDNMTIIGKH